MPGLPEAHSGPAFTTLAGLAQFAASKELDLRQLGSAEMTVQKSDGGNIVQRLIAAFRTQY
jgi:cell division protein FtsA